MLLIQSQIIPDIQDLTICLKNRRSIPLYLIDFFLLFFLYLVTKKLLEVFLLQGA